MPAKITSKRAMLASIVLLSMLLVITSCTPCTTCKKQIVQTPPVSQPSAPISWDIITQHRLLGKCMNLGNALEAPTEGAWGVVLKKSYFSHIASLGFNSVRIPVRWSAHTDTVAPFTIDSVFMKRVQWAVDQAETNNLRAIINIHHFEQLMLEPDRYTPVFLAIWKQVAAGFSAYGPELYFEICNEPNGAVDANRWNDLARQALAIVRENNPTRSVIIGPGNWNDWASFADLSLPADSFLIATFHYYQPFPFTHQGASWLKGTSLWNGTRWRASFTDTSFIIKRFDAADAWVRKHNIPLFLGEFGAIDSDDSTSRALYTACIAKEALKRKWSYAYWKYNGNFGVFDDQTGVTRMYLVNALLKPDSTFSAFMKLAKSDTIATPPTGSDNYLMLDDFNDGQLNRNSLANMKSINVTAAPPGSCTWYTWVKDSCRVFDTKGSKIPAGSEKTDLLVGPWGREGNGLFLKAVLSGSNYPTAGLSTGFSGDSSVRYDLSTLTAISFYAKGRGLWTLDVVTDTILNGYPASDNWGNFSVTFEPGESWKLFVVPVTALHPKPWSKPQQDMVPWSAGMKRVSAINFCSSQQYGKVSNDSLELFLDDITLHGLNAAKLKRAQ